MKYTNYVTYLLILFITTTLSIAQTKEEAFNYLKEKIKNIETISFNFASISNPQNKGFILANKKNQFKLSTPQRLLISDGESVWNYDISQKQVVVSDLNQTNSASLQNIFFTITEKYKPINLQSSLNSRKGSNWVLTIESTEKPGEIVEITYDNKYNISQVKFMVGKNYENIRITNLKYNPKTTKESFKFTPPKDIEVIDLR